MQAGTFDASATITEGMRRRVYVNGVHRHHVSDSWDAEIGSDLPAQVSGVDGSFARTGEVTFAPVADVVDVMPSPLRRTNSWPPRRGDELEIYDEVETQRWKRATGRVTNVSAPLASGEVRVEWSDDLKASLSAPSELPPVAASMPGNEVIESGQAKRYWKRTAVEPWGAWVEALEDAGYRILPSPSAGTGTVSLYALHQGTAYPRVGFIQQTYSTGDLLAWDNTSGFQYLNQWSYFAPAFGGRAPGDDLQVFMRTTKGGPSANARFTVSATQELRVILSGTSNSVICQLVTDGTAQTIIQQGFTTESDLPWVGVSFGPDALQLWTADGVTRQRFYADAGISGTVPLDWTQVRCYATAAIMVKYGTRSGWNSFNWPSLRFRSTGPWLVREPTCLRTVENTPVIDVLSNIAKATLTGFWLDEHGIMQIAPSSVLESRTPVATITTRADVLAGSWTETMGGVASSVVVNYEAGVISSASQVRVTVLESSGSKAMVKTDTETDIVGPGPDEEWIEPDMSPLNAADNGDLSMKRALFSIWGGSYVSTEGVDDDGNPDADLTTYGWAQSRGWLSIDVSPISPRQWAVTHSVGDSSAGVPPSGEIQLIVLPASKQVPVEWRGKPLPVWRARGRVLFTDASEVSNLGPSWAPAYTHELGAWGSKADARRVADWLGARMADVQIVLDRLSVQPDPRRQLGDVVTVQADVSLGGTLTCLIVGMHESSSEDGIKQELTLRVISTTSTDPVTYADVESSATTYAGIESKTAYSVVESGA